MFETIDHVQWHLLTHAYGLASDVPQMLRDLVHEDEDVREEALWGGLHSAIIHQGTLYRATPYVIPFLFEILENEQARSLPVLDDPLERHLLSFLRDCAASAVGEAEGARLRGTVLRLGIDVPGQIRRRLLDGDKTIRIFLDHDDEETRAYAADLVEFANTLRML